MKYMTLVILTIAAAACSRTEATRSEAKSDNVTTTSADNTEKNVRDRRTETLTPEDQGGSELDRTITQHVRQAVMKSDDLSMTGKNVKIITVDGVVTLRGPVQSDHERAEIAGMAQKVAGVKRVDNQLEIAAK